MNDVTDPGIAAARSDVLARIAAATKSAGRDPASVALVAVSKTQPDDRIEAMLSTGQRVFGENRVQEAEGRWQKRRGGSCGVVPHRRTRNPRERQAPIFEAPFVLVVVGRGRKGTIRSARQR